MKMRLVTITIVTMSAIIWALPVTAPAASSTPIEILMRILEADFRADTTARFDVVEITVPRKYDTPRPEVVDFEGGAINVASSYHVTYSASDPATSNHRFDVQFVICATTSGNGAARLGGSDSREIVPLAKSHIVTLAYFFSLKAGKWKLVDPPIAMVSREGLLSSLNDRLSALSDKELLQKLDQVGGDAKVNNIILRRWLGRQIDVLQNLRC